MTIKHLVIPGGGPTGVIALGALQYLEKNKYWDINEIESIYATSVGSILSVLIAMKFEWEMIVDYIIERPWHEAFPININSFFDAFSKKGLFDIKFMEIFFKPFFNAKDISLDITVNDFYKYTKIELHVFSLEINNFEVANISYKTYPDLPLLTAIHMSCAIPIIFSPVCIEDKCYVDGGVVCNYPLKYCIESVEDKNEIFAINNHYLKEDNKVNNDSNIMDYIMIFIGKLILNVNIDVEADANTNTNTKCIYNELIFKTTHMSLVDIKNTIYNKITREELLNSGIEKATLFLEEIKKKKEEEKEEKEKKEKDKIEM